MIWYLFRHRYRRVLIRCPRVYPFVDLLHHTRSIFPPISYFRCGHTFDSAGTWRRQEMEDLKEPPRRFQSGTRYPRRTLLSRIWIIPSLPLSFLVPAASRALQFLARILSKISLHEHCQLISFKSNYYGRPKNVIMPPERLRFWL